MTKFIKYEENNDQTTKDKGFLGIITFENKDGDILCYKVQRAKEGNKGYFIVAFSANMNNQWYKAHTIDRNSVAREVEEYLRTCVNAYYSGSSYPVQQKKSIESPTPTYMPPSFSEPELPF